MVFDLDNNTVGISAKPAVSTVRRGRVKKVIDLLKVPLDVSLSPFIKVRAISRKSSTDEDIENLRGEIARMQLYANDLHVMHVEASYEHFSQSRSLDAQGRPIEQRRISMELPKFEHHGAEIVHNPGLLIFTQKLQLFKDFIEGIFPYHKRGCIHGDIKPHNFVFTKKATGRVSIVGNICDFGSVVEAKVGEPLLRFACQYTAGYYGGVIYTSPELFGVRNFAGDHYQTEVFAIGISLHEMLYRHAPKWTTIISDAFKDMDTETGIYKEKYKDPAKLYAAQEQLKTLVKKEIDESSDFNDLVEKRRIKQKLTQEEEMKLLIYSMLRFDPKERITLDSARLEIRKILISHPPLKKPLRVSV